MKSRILLTEIPHGKFHSAIFTTYSLNLYYFEQQVLPLLGSKGIHYISILADSNMLTNQLNSFCLLSQAKKRCYAVHGIQCNGAFHPKMIFLAGDDNLLLLIGSGNLTSSGHGKNLEVWNAIYVNEPDDNKLGLLIQAWKYIKMLHADLGASAQYKLKTIEENCTLLSDVDNISQQTSYTLDEDSEISFLATTPTQSLFAQLSKIVGNEGIDCITIMSPFYDSEGAFIHLLNKQFNPTEINIIVQQAFGNVPNKNIKSASNINFYDWADIKEEKIKQDYFHAKNIIFQGKTRNYLLSGSANASIAAFGIMGNDCINQEACVLYQSKHKDYLADLGIKIMGENVDIGEFENQTETDERAGTEQKSLVFIKTIEKHLETIVLYFSAPQQIQNVTITICNSKGNIEHQKENIDIAAGNSELQLNISENITVLYGELHQGSISISNKQFIIDIKAFERTNPSQENRAFSQIRNLIEGGYFSSSKIIDYLSTIYKQKNSNKKSLGASDDENSKKDDILEEENKGLYLPYEEIQEHIKHLGDTQQIKGYTEYKSIRLWESIFAYLKENLRKTEEEEIEEEETENAQTSSGREIKKPSTSIKPIKQAIYEKLKAKVEKFLTDYLNILKAKVQDNQTDKPNLIDLSMFLIVLEILLHLFSHKEKVEVETEITEEILLLLNFNDRNYSWSQYVLECIGLFTLWCARKGGLKEVDDKAYLSKLTQYQRMAFKTSLGTLALFSLTNKIYHQEKIAIWCKLGLLNAKKYFDTENLTLKEIAEINLFVPKESVLQVGEACFTDEINQCLIFLTENFSDTTLPTINAFYLHPKDGFTYLERITPNPKVPLKPYLKLFHIGYEWNEDNSNYWNDCLYDTGRLRWVGVRRR